MAMPTFTMRQLIEAGVHFGHSTRRWNPKMGQFIFGDRNGVHILNLDQTVPLLGRALEAVRETVAKGGRVLFVGTKRQAADLIAEYAGRSGQFYVNHRWLGGMLTNWQTISASIKRMRAIEEKIDSGEVNALTKKEQLNLTRDHEKLKRTLNGIRDMGGLPDIIFVIDTNKEHLAIAEAKVLGIPVVAIVDSNSDPDGIEYPVPGNDDALRAINLYCELVSDAVLDGIQAEMIGKGVDLGAAEAVPEEAALTEDAGSEPAQEEPSQDADSAQEAEPSIEETVASDAHEAAPTQAATEDS